MWCRAVKFGGDSGAVQQVSDIGGGFGRVPFTARHAAVTKLMSSEKLSARPSVRGRAGLRNPCRVRHGRAPPACAECVGSPAYSRGFSLVSDTDPSPHGERALTLAVLIRGACPSRHFRTRSTCRISLKATAEWSMPLPADWPSPLTV